MKDSSSTEPLESVEFASWKEIFYFFFFNPYFSFIDIIQKEQKVNK